MARYHINSDGNPGECRAQTACPFGQATDHYVSKEAARADYEARMANETFPRVGDTKVPSAAELAAAQSAYFTMSRTVTTQSSPQEKVAALAAADRLQELRRVRLAAEEANPVMYDLDRLKLAYDYARTNLGFTIQAVKEAEPSPLKFRQRRALKQALIEAKAQDERAYHEWHWAAAIEANPGHYRF